MSVASKCEKQVYLFNARVVANPICTMSVKNATKTSSESSSKSDFLKFFSTFSVVLLVVCVSFICGYFTNVIHRAIFDEKVQPKTDSIDEMSRKRRLASDFRSQLLNSLKAKNMKENLE